MSKGMGTIERQALEIVATTNKVLWPAEIAAKIFGFELPKYWSKRYPHKIPDAKIGTVRRALRSLVKRGLIESMGRRFRGGQIGYANPAYAADYRKRSPLGR